MLNTFRLRCIPWWIWMAAGFCLIFSLLIGYSLYRQTIELVFVPYDITGKQLQNASLLKVSPDSVPIQPLGRAVLSKPVGTQEVLTVQNGDAPSFTEPVTWMSLSEYRSWLENKLPLKLSESDPQYNKTAWGNIIGQLKSSILESNNKYSYPILFSAQKNGQVR